MEEDTYDVIDDSCSSRPTIDGDREYDYIELKSPGVQKGLKVSPLDVMATNQGNFNEGGNSNPHESVRSASDASTGNCSENREMEEVEFDIMANPAYVSKHAHSNRH